MTIKDGKTSIRKHTDKLKVPEKTMRTAIKQDLKWKLFAKTLTFFEFKAERKKAHEVQPPPKKKHKFWQENFFSILALKFMASIKSRP